MNILFDFITLQDEYINGGMEYTYVVLNALLQYEKNKIFGLVNKNRGIPQRLQKLIDDFHIYIFGLDEDLSKFVESEKIEKFYIGIAQRYNDIDLTKLNCKIIITCHDVNDLSREYANTYLRNTKKFYDQFENEWQKTKNIKTKILSCLKWVLVERKYEHPLVKYRNFQNLLKKENVYVITVSEYSKYAIEYFFDDIKNEVKYFFAPHKEVGVVSNTVEDKKLLDLIDSKKRYFILLSCSRLNKNAQLFFEQWEKFCRVTNNEYYALMLDKIKITGTNIIHIDELNTSDLENALKNSYALVYPSTAEGFGYPPVETMKYGVPIVCAYSTSIPEVVGDGAVMFNPYYPEDLYKALFTLINNYPYYKSKSEDRYSDVIKKQKEDFLHLIEYIQDC